MRWPELRFRQAAINVTGLGGFIFGPNANAPQNTYQQNRQTKYDASWVKGRHTIQFGVEYNRIDEAGFASFFGLGPEIQGRFANGVATDPFNADGAADPLNYQMADVVVGNGLGYGSEKPVLGLPHGGFTNNRIGVYGHDTWKSPGISRSTAVCATTTTTVWRTQICPAPHLSARSTRNWGRLRRMTTNVSRRSWDLPGMCLARQNRDPRWRRNVLRDQYLQ